MLDFFDKAAPAKLRLVVQLILSKPIPEPCLAIARVSATRRLSQEHNRIDLATISTMTVVRNQDLRIVDTARRTEDEALPTVNLERIEIPGPAEEMLI